MKQIKKYISILLITLFLSVQNVPYVVAQEATTETSSPTTETQSTTTEITSIPSSESTPDTTGSPTVNTDTSTSSVTPDSSEDDDEEEEDIDEPTDAAREEERRLKKEQWLIDREARRQAAAEAAAASAAQAAQDLLSSAATQNGGMGDASIDTGNGTNTAVIATDANNNLAGNGPSASVSDFSSGASVVNSGNGTGSANNGSATIGNDNNINQNNSATVNTNLDQSTITGSNSVSDNTGGNASIDTGDANVSGTVITTVNTNAAGVMVSEFNVADDHVGDLVLDFAANCISGCFSGDLLAKNSENGSDSTNTSNLDLNNTTNTFQNNEASIGNDLVLSADSGSNTSSRNTDGDSSITTGDANVSANVLTMANNNIAGNVIYGVVNIFGDLIGDIILSEAMMNACCGGSVTAANTGNGTGSSNTSDVSISNNDTTFQNNDATIANNLVFDANSGGNESNRNTGGDSSISTGDTSIDANILNIANSNILGGNMWLVIVNEAGNWVGKILGAPAGQTFAGADGSEFMVDENGYITAVINAGNGADSTNNASLSETNTNTTTQNNTANISNNLVLSANTGDNTTSNNTGGNSNIETGDATIVANLVNFVNNNISGNGKLFVTVINVFGSWMGDFVAPGQAQEATQSTASDNTATHTEDSRGGGTDTNNNTGLATAPSNSSKKSVNSTTSVDEETAVGMVAGISDSASGIGGGLLSFAGIGEDIGREKKMTTLVKEASTEKGSNDIESAGLTVNLAWFIVLGPLGIIAILGKKYLYRRMLPTA